MEQKNARSPIPISYMQQHLFGGGNVGNIANVGNVGNAPTNLVWKDLDGKKQINSLIP